MDINVSEVRSNAETLIQCANEMDGINKRFQTLIQKINGTWDGAASQAFIALLQRQYEKNDGLDELLREYGRQLNAIAKEAEEADKKSKNWFQSIWDGVKSLWHKIFG